VIEKDLYERVVARQQIIEDSADFNARDTGRKSQRDQYEGDADRSAMRHDPFCEAKSHISGVPLLYLKSVPQRAIFVSGTDHCGGPGN